MTNSSDGVAAPTACEVAEQFFTNSIRLNDAQRAWLLARGISDSAVETDPYTESGPLRFASVVFGEQYFDFATTGNASAVSAFVLICRDWDGATTDIAAFNKDRLALWLRRAPSIGEQLVLGPRLGEPLQVFDSIWAWLRGGRDGILPVDWKRTARLLEDVSICVNSVEFGQVLSERLARPAPPIFVKTKTRAAA